MRSNLTILLAEDDDNDVFLLKRAFQAAEIPHPLQVARDGREAVELLAKAREEGDAPLPALIILDIKMPRLNGIEALRWIRDQPVVRRVPVFIFSSSADAGDVEEAYEGGANGYFVKPAGTAERTHLARLFKEWMGLNQPPLAARTSFNEAAGFRAGGDGGRKKHSAR